jgi:hypothetical protein
MKRFGIVVLVVVFVLAAFWLGLMLNFPGVTVSRYVERQVNRHQGFDLVLTPAELRWNRLYVARAEVRRHDNPEAKPLVVVTDFAVPVTWRLLRGLPARGSLGTEGYVEAFLPWGLGESGRVDAEVNLSELPLPAVLAPLAVAGQVELHGRFTLDAQAQAGTRLPDGTITGTGRGLVVSGVRVAGSDLPPTRLETLDVELTMGRTLDVRRFEFRGDIQGAVQGSITPNLRDPRSSPLALRITAAARDTWLLRLGDLRPLAEGLLQRGRLALNLTGTVGSPQLAPVAGGG